MRIFSLFILLFTFFFVLPVNAENKYPDYSLKKLLDYPYKTSAITIQELAFNNSIQHAYNVSFTSMKMQVSARLSIPAIRQQDIKGIVIMLRGHQHPAGYYTGKGTEYPARHYLEQGWAIIAPDFLGYASSSPAPAPRELHQLYSVINAVELYQSMEQPVFNYAASVPQTDRITMPQSFKKIALWGHSNGGQVAVHSLIILQKPIATVLWAPVTLAYPDNVAHYRGSAQWLENFYKEYKTAEFSLYNYLDKIAPDTPILLEQGDKDYAVPIEWSDTFSKAIEQENTRRQQTGRGKINLQYNVYKNADHNLNPYWNTVLPGNVAFWNEN